MNICKPHISPYTLIFEGLHGKVYSLPFFSGEKSYLETQPLSVVHHPAPSATDQSNKGFFFFFFYTATSHSGINHSPEDVTQTALYRVQDWSWAQTNEKVINLSHCWHTLHLNTAFNAHLLFRSHHFHIRDSPSLFHYFKRERHRVRGLCLCISDFSKPFINFFQPYWRH